MLEYDGAAGTIQRWFVYGGGDSIVSTMYTIRACMMDGAVNAAYAASRATESVWNFLTSAIGREPIIDISDPNAVKMADQHPLMMSECSRQCDDLSFIALASPLEELKRKAQIDAPNFLPLVNR